MVFHRFCFIVVTCLLLSFPPWLVQVRVAVFAKGEDAAAATAAGADIVGADDLLASVMEGMKCCCCRCCYYCCDVIVACILSKGLCEAAAVVVDFNPPPRAK